jgi:hypothetical protein
MLSWFANLVETGQTKIFVIWPDEVVGTIVHGAEGVKKCFSGTFLDAEWSVLFIRALTSQLIRALQSN